jgi:hypothetical protein
MYDIGAGAAPLVQAVVQGGSVWDECRKLADMCQSDMYVQVGGVLEIHPWKTPYSAVDVALPREAVDSVTRSRGGERGPSRVRIRGRYVSKYDCGPRLLNVSPTNTPSSVKKDKCYSSGLGEPSSDIILKNLGGSNADLANASYLLDGDLVYNTMNESDKEASASIHTRPDPITFPDNFLPQGGLTSVGYKVLARNKSSGELDSISSRDRFKQSAVKRQDVLLACQ